MSDAGKDWKQEEKRVTEDEMGGWHHRLNGPEFEQASRVGDGWGSLACCSPWGHKESDTTEWLNWTDPDKWASQIALEEKNPPANAEDLRGRDLIPGLGRSPGRGHGNPFQYSCLENLMDRGAWQDTVHRVTKSWTWLKWLSTRVVVQFLSHCNCDCMDCNMPGLPVLHYSLELAQTHVHGVQWLHPTISSSACTHGHRLFCLADITWSQRCGSGGETCSCKTIFGETTRFSGVGVGGTGKSS